MNRRYSKSLKKADLINLNNLLQDENEILKKEITNLNSLIKSQEERHKTEITSCVSENDRLLKTNSQLVQSLSELQEALKVITGNCQESLSKRDRVPKPSISTRVLKNKENLQVYNESVSRSTRYISQDRISPLRAGLMKNSKQLLALVSKMKRLQKVSN